MSINSIGSDVTYLILKFLLPANEVPVMINVNKHLRFLTKKYQSNIKYYYAIFVHYCGPFVKNLESLFKLFCQDNYRFLPIIPNDLYPEVKTSYAVHCRATTMLTEFRKKFFDSDDLKIRALSFILMGLKTIGIPLFETFTDELSPEIKNTIKASMTDTKNSIESLKYHLNALKKIYKNELFSFKRKRDICILERLVYKADILVRFSKLRSMVIPT